MSQKKEKMNSKKCHERMCICCGQMKEKGELLRIIKTKDGDILIDKTGKLNGRGAYLCDDRACFTKAYKKKGFDRSFHEGVPAEVYEALQQEFERDGDG